MEFFKIIGGFRNIFLIRELFCNDFSNLLKALKTKKNTNFIFTKANADPGGQVINDMIDKFVKQNKNNAFSYTSLGRITYLSLLKFAQGVIGNSSSGVVEAPSFGIGTINIGDRQKGRVMPKSVICCKPDYKSIIAAMRILYSKNRYMNFDNQ